jgi:hypothetical protein
MSDEAGVRRIDRRPVWTGNVDGKVCSVKALGDITVDRLSHCGSTFT